ncbi:MAG: PH domain-containing protein [Deltaproteobacteria bacterium]|nr:PH domain-containing protein [Deltaproteobacteria bacterium]
MTGSEPWMRLHPASIAVNLVPRAWRVIRAAWPAVIALALGRQADRSGALELAMGVAFFAATVGSTFIHYLTLRYRVVDGRLELRSGLLRRQIRVIDGSRVQNVELVRGVFHKLSGLVEVRIETASGTEVEGLLSALSVEDGQALIDRLSEVPRRAVPAEEHLIASTWTDAFLFGATGFSVARVTVLFVVVQQGLMTLTASSTVPEVFATPVGVLLLGLASVSGAWLVGTGAAMLTYHRFRLVVEEGGLVAESGLLTRRRVELRPSKVQLVLVQETLLRRLAGFGSVRVETAAARPQGQGSPRSVAFVPVVPRARIGEIAAAFTGAPWLEGGLQAPDPRALWLNLIQSLGTSGALAVGISWWLWPWGLISALYPPLAAWLSWKDFQSQGWRVDEEQIVARRGWWTRQQVGAVRAKVQAVEVRCSLPQRLLGLAQVRVRVAGASFAMPLMDRRTAAAQERILATGRVARGSVAADLVALLGAPEPQVLEHHHQGGEPDQLELREPDQHQAQHSEHVAAPPSPRDEADTPEHLH